MSERAACRIVVLISGDGSNLQTFIDLCASGQLRAEIAAVISNKSNAFGLQRAQNAGIPASVIPHRDFDSRETFDAALAEAIEVHNPELVVLAGFMRILTSGFVQRFTGKLINIHPSLLPKYPGLNTHQRAIDADDSHGGATVHFVTEQLDGGPPIAQIQVPIQTDDTADELAQRVRSKEHELYPLAAHWFAHGRLALENNEALLDGKALPQSGIDISDNSTQYWDSAWRYC